MDNDCDGEALSRMVPHLNARSPCHGNTPETGRTAYSYAFLHLQAQLALCTLENFRCLGWSLFWMVESIHWKEINNAVCDPSLFILIQLFRLNYSGVLIFSEFNTKIMRGFATYTASSRCVNIPFHQEMTGIAERTYHVENLKCLNPSLHRAS